ncbi:MAG: phosphoglycerate kinase [Candidatus Woesearchaeota archaeon]
MYFKLNELEIKDKIVLIRVDYNVPLKNKIIQDDLRIKASLDTINLVLQKGAKKIILMSHVGRPKGKFVDELSTLPIAKRLSELLNIDVAYVNDCINYELPNEKIIMLENLRFYEEETNNDNEFAKKLAEKSDIYINDAFGTCHRKEASVYAITNHLLSVPGLLLEKEINSLNLENIEKPFIFLLGGSKLDTKLPIIKNMLNKADKILLGGAMIFNFYKAKGYEIGNSLFQEDMLKEAKELLNNDKIVLPRDIVVSKEISNESEYKTVDADKIEDKWIGLDIGKKTIEDYIGILKSAKIIVWNGPMGMFEIENFSIGTFEIAKFLSNSDSRVIVGGGDSALAIQKLNLNEKFYHVSTGGGASLELLSGKELPALKALKENYIKFS